MYMKLSVAIIIILVPAQFQENKQGELKTLINNLSDSDQKTRELNQEKILQLIRKEARTNGNVKSLIKEIKNAISNATIKEVKMRLTNSLDKLTNGEWKKMKDCPFSITTKSTKGTGSFIFGNKLIIWANDSSNKFFSNAVMYDIDKDDWLKMKECPISRHDPYKCGFKDNLII